MSRMGALGAIGGAAGGLSKFLSEELAQKRAMTLEQQRTENRRETNRMNNEMRHEFSLTELKARGEQGKDLATFEQDLKAQSQPQFEDSEFNGLPGQRNTQTGEFKPLTGQGNYRPASKIQEAEYLLNMGVPEDQVREYMLGNRSKPQVEWKSTTDLYTGEEDKTPYQVVTDENGNARLIPVPVGDGERGGPSSAMNFKTADEALAAARQRYPGVAENTLVEHLKAKFPHLYAE